MTTSIAPGVFDIIPDYLLPENETGKWRGTHLWCFLEDEIRKIAAAYGFQEIRTPIFERTELFQRSVGAATDIVSKEMYTFIDKGNRSMSLRPEGTASAMRAFIEAQTNQAAQAHKLFYISPMFRYERSQAGRYRQHHQFGAEVIGNAGPEQDVELIDMLYTLYGRLGLKNLTVNINSIGDKTSREAYREALVDYMNTYRSELSEESKVRLEVNPLRILDSKDAKDRAIVANAPSILKFLNQECHDHFIEVQNLLKILNIPFEINPSLVRGLDYYNKTVFEITACDLGAQNSIAGGGRYDGLLKTMGGPDLPATGFGTGLERVIQTMLKQNVPLPAPPIPEVFIIALGDLAKPICFSTLHKLRLLGISATMDFSNRKINKIMQYAHQLKAANVVVIGETEVKNGFVELKEMSSGNKRKVPLNNIAAILHHEKQSDNFVRLLNPLTKPFEDAEEAAYFVNHADDAIADVSQATDRLKNAVEQLKTFLE